MEGGGWGRGKERERGHREVELILLTKYSILADACSVQHNNTTHSGVFLQHCQLCSQDITTWLDSYFIIFIISFILTKYTSSKVALSPGHSTAEGHAVCLAYGVTAKWQHGLAWCRADRSYIHRTSPKQNSTGVDRCE